MRTLYLIAILSFGAISAMCQSLPEQIISTYDKLNKADYCYQLTDANKKYYNDLFAKSLQNTYLRGEDSLLYVAKLLSERDGMINDFTNMINEPNPYFVLKLDIVNNQFAIDTSLFKFDLYWFGEPYGPKGKSIAVGLLPGPIAHMNNYCFYTAFSKVMPRRAVKAMRKILKKDPYCILACYEIWALPYLLDGKLYIYDLVSMKEYEADFYMQNIYKQ